MDPLTAVAVWTASLTGIAALVRAATWAASAPKDHYSDESPVRCIEHYRSGSCEPHPPERL